MIAELPDIDWDKYSLVGVRAGSRKPETRNKGKTNGATDATEKESGATDSARLELAHLTSKGQILVRGRVFEEGKPRTFNQPWTPEEQQRLEELLLRFPSEEVEMERWKKIASALGNRTAIQVQSRTQKYFLKLQKAGLPIPGRQLKAKHRTGTPTVMGAVGAGSPATVTRSGRQVVKTAKRSTFFPALHPVVKMTEEEEDHADGGMASYSSVFQDPLPASRTPILNDGYYLEEEDVSDEEDVDDRLKSSAEYQELMWLKRVRREQELEQQRPGGPMVHAGFRCDGCDVSPIVGGRFQCAECLAPDTVDFCCECAPKGLEVAGGRHDRSHVLRPVRKKTTVDQEYWVVSNSGYLDPNFVR